MCAPVDYKMHKNCLIFWDWFILPFTFQGGDVVMFFDEISDAYLTLSEKNEENKGVLILQLNI